MKKQSSHSACSERSERSDHWANIEERGNSLTLKITAIIVRYFPFWLIKICVYVVVFYFYLSSPRERKNIHRYQTFLKQATPSVSFPAYFSVLRQFIEFGVGICDRFAVWQKKIRYQDIVVSDPDHIYAEMDTIKQHKRGHIFICSHLGNMEICRALVSHHQDFVLNVLVHDKHAQAFNQALKETGADHIQLIQVSDLDVRLMLSLNQRLEAGEWIAIAADRIPVRGEKVIEVDFLGHMASFPQGPWILAALLKAPVHLLFCVKEKGQYSLKLKHVTQGIHWQRNNRQAVLTACIQDYAKALHQVCINHPLQWFNFYDFWKKND